MIGGFSRSSCRALDEVRPVRLATLRDVRFSHVCTGSAGRAIAAISRNVEAFRQKILHRTSVASSRAVFLPQATQAEADRAPSQCLAPAAFSGPARGPAQARSGRAFAFRPEGRRKRLARQIGIAQQPPADPHLLAQEERHELLKRLRRRQAASLGEAAQGVFAGAPDRDQARDGLPGASDREPAQLGEENILVLGNGGKATGR